MEIKTIQCPHCGNQDINSMELRIERPVLFYHPLYQNPKGGIYAQDYATDEQDVASQTSSDIYCRACCQAFDNPGISLK